MLKTKPIQSLIIFFSLLMVTSSVHSQKLRFERLGIEKGLVHSNVTKICSTKDGLLWIATLNGLSRYDGYEFRSYTTDAAFPNNKTIRNNTIQTIFSDNAGMLWIAYANGGLDRYSPITEQFEQIKISTAKKRKENTAIKHIFQDQAGNIWLGASAGFFKYDSISNTVKEIMTDNGIPISSRVNAIEEVKDGKIMFSTGTQRHYSNDGLYLIDNTHKTAKQIPLMSMAALPYAPSVKCFTLDQMGNLWVGTYDHGLLTFSFNKYLNQEKAIKANQILLDDTHTDENNVNSVYQMVQVGKHLMIGTKFGIMIRDLTTGKMNRQFYRYKDLNEIAVFAVDHKNRVWIGSKTEDKGICVYDPQTEEMSCYYHDSDDLNSISSTEISDFYIDKNNILWIGSNLGGLNKLDLLQKRFHTYRFSEKNKNALSSNKIFGMDETDDGKILIATLNGLNILNPITQSFDHIKTQQIKLNQDELFTIEYTNKDSIWLGYRDKQFSVLDLDDRNNRPYRFNISDSSSLDFWSIRSILKDSKGKIWIGAQKGLCYYNPKQDKYFKINEQQGFNASKISIIYETLEGDLWVGTFTDGIYIKKNGENHFKKTFSTENTEPYQIADNFIRCINQAEDSSIWIGTNKAGLIRFKNGQLYNYQLHNKPNNVSVLGILFDESGFVWASTTNGLIKLEPKNGQYRNYLEEDGIQSKQFNINSYLKSREGKMYFGGVNGLTAFAPNEIIDNPHPNEIQLLSFSLFNELIAPGDTVNGEVLLNQSINYTKEITLTHDQNVFAIAFTSNHLSNPQKIQYKLMLENYDKDWQIQNSKNRVATYTNLAPGEYTFKAKAGNSDNLWNGKTKELKITILPPWWQTTTFRITLLVSIVSAIIALSRRRTLNLKRQKEILKKQVKDRTEELETQYNNIKVLTQIGQHITASVKIETIVKRLYEQLNQLMNAPTFSIGLINKETQVIDFTGFINHNEKLKKEHIPLNATNRLSVWCIEHREVVFMNDVENESSLYLKDEIGEYVEAHSPKSAIYLPLMSKKQDVLGIMIVKSHKKNSYSDFHLNTLKNLAAYVAIAIDNAYAYREIEDQSKRLQEVNEIKTRFYTNISHELRTPLSLIIEPARQLAKAENVNMQNKKSASLIHNNSLRLLNLVDQLMDLSKVEDKAMQLYVQPLVINEALAIIADSFQFLAKKKRVDFTWHCKPSEIKGYVDKDKLEKICYNLLHNAFKHVKEGGKIELKAQTKDNGHLQISIVDNGIGISKKDMAKITERYYRANENTNTEGTGIGLFLVKKLVELYRGKIVFNSVRQDEQKNQPTQSGTNINIELPINIAHFRKEEILQLDAAIEYKNENEQKEAEGILPLSILLAEDNEELRNYLASELQEKYTHVLLAENGKVALDILQTQSVDVIISDIMMPVMDGVALCNNIKSTPSTSHIPVVLLTAKASIENELEGLESGADEYITKPFNKEILFKRLANLVYRRQAIQQAISSDFDKIEESEFAEKDKQFLKELRGLIIEDMENHALSAEQMAKALNMSKSLLYKKVKALTGRSVHDFMQNIRLQKAYEMLKNKEGNISEIAYRTGFNSPTYFGRLFKKEFGHTPSQILTQTI